MRYLNLLLILVVIGCYSGVHTSNFNLTKETKPSCHNNSSVQMVHHTTLDLNIQAKKNSENQSCCIKAVNYQIDYELIRPVLTVSIINYFSLQSNTQKMDNFRDNNLKNHSPPKIFISKSSFLI